MNNNNGSKFFDGLLWGAILGGGLVFLLGTKKGKKILKMITEEGVESLSEILEAKMDGEDLEEDGEDIDEVIENPSMSGNGISKDSQSNEPREEVKSPRKRFFRKRTS